MEQCLTFVVPGDPQGKARPRFARAGRGVRTYTPNSTQKYEELVRYCAVSARQKEKVKPISADMSLSIKAYFKVPQSYSNKRRHNCLAGVERPSKKPDSDNIAKIILDGLNPKMRKNHVTHKAENFQEGLYRDDKQVVSLHVEKWYGEEPKVEITAEWQDDS